MADWKQFEKTPSLELIELIKMRNKDAFYAFYFRFVQQLAKSCEIVCKNWHFDSDFATEVTEKTFDRFWKYPKYNNSLSSAADPDKGIILYLFQIAKNILADLWRQKNGKIKNPYNGSEEIVWDYPKADDDCGDIEDIHCHYSVVMEALNTLSEKHKIIFYTYAKYEAEGFKLPRKLLQELRNKLNISQQTIRSYNNEAKNKILEYKKIYGIK